MNPRSAGTGREIYARSAISQVPVARLVTTGGHNRDERHSTRSGL
jgi:hypothetical protein